jgi:NAD(P)-dependent dehydrogenase (short-subunit alcohol dehydrogenase family)
MLLVHKKIVVIGGTSGIGLAAAKYFCEQGASVVSLGKKENITAEEEISKENHHKIFADATLETSAELAIKTCQQLFGGFDGLLHVAGGSGRSFGDGPLNEISLDGWEKTISLNATTVMLSNKAAINAFLRNGKSGAIVNISSVLATNPAPHFFTTHAYAASKAAIIGLSKSVAGFYAKNNIRINVISPGLIESPMSKRAVENELIMEYIKTKQPLDGGRIGQPDDISGMAALLLSNQGSFITGQNILVDGGWSISEGQY